MLYILRHGQTDYNLKRITQGRGVNSELNAAGLAQAQAFHAKYNAHPFEHIYTSSLIRTHQTVGAFTQPKTALTELDEISWGVFEGKSEVERTGERLGDISVFINRWNSGEVTAKVSGGESAQDVADRLLSILPQLRAHTNDILVCTHGRTLRILMCLLTNTPLTAQDKFPHKNTSLYVVDQTKVHTFNDLGHIVVKP